MPRPPARRDRLGARECPGLRSVSDYPVSYSFLTGAVLTGTEVDADPPGANNFKCRPTSRHPRPVVLVHGTAGNKNTNSQTYAPLLANNGLLRLSLTYDVTTGTPKGPDQLGGMDRIETSAARLRTFVNRVRSATGSAFMQKMRKGGVAVKGITYSNIVTRYDELVSPYTSGIETGMRNIVVQGNCAGDYTEHFEIAVDPVAAGYVLNALDPAHPRPVSCTTVLPFEGPVT